MRRTDDSPAASVNLADTSLWRTGFPDELFDEFGPASFSGQWQQDPRGLLAAAIAYLADLSLLRPVPGGVLVAPAALRYRNIRAALPEPPQQERLPLEPPADGRGES